MLRCLDLLIDMLSDVVEYAAFKDFRRNTKKRDRPVVLNVFFITFLIYRYYVRNFPFLWENTLIKSFNV